MNKLIAVILLNCSFLFFAEAQINPPSFLCVKGDTLFWDLPTNSCGPFVSYDVYTSNDANGPYTLLSSVTDPLQAFFYDPNPAGLLRYYYLLSNYDCPGETQVSSDTLDSYPPTVSPLTDVTVQGTDVLLNWTASTSPEVYAYIIYRRDPVGVIPIDTVFNGLTSYTDPNAEPTMESEGYFVNALDRCGNTSVFDEEHKTIFVEATATNCSIELSWTPYEGWANGIDRQEVWVSENGSPPVLHETLDGGMSSYGFRAVSDGSTFCFFIRSAELNGNGASQSNEACVTATFLQPVNELFIYNVDVQPDNSVAIDWGITPDADVQTVSFERAEGQIPFDLIETLVPTATLPETNQYQDLTADADVGPVSFQVQVVDSCDNQLTAVPATTIYLTVAPSGNNNNFLTWTPLVVDNATVDSYKISRIVNGTSSDVGTVTGGQFDYEDSFDPLVVGGSTICYQVTATGNVTFPDGMSRVISSRSNIACLDQDVQIFIPNALAPSGFNREFKPVISSSNIAVYTMEIFDRYGSIVFSTDNVDNAWNGKKEGKRLPQGVYVYRIYLELENGNKEERKGFVTLLQ